MSKTEIIPELPGMHIFIIEKVFCKINAFLFPVLFGIKEKHSVHKLSLANKCFYICLHQGRRNPSALIFFPSVRTVTAPLFIV